MKTILFSTLLTVFFVSTIAAQTPIAHWPLDGNSNDIIGNKNGTIVGGVSFVNDATRGDCAQFDGVDGVINLPYPIWESETDTNTTITCWFNWAGGDGWQRVYSLGMTDGAWMLMYYTPMDGDGNHRITFKTVVPDLWTEFIGADALGEYGVLQVNTWYFSAIVMEADTVRIYMNDQLLVDQVLQVTPQKIQPDISQNVLGKSHWPDPTFNGMIDDFRIYGEALTTEEILDIYNDNDVSGINDIATGLALDFYGVDGRIFYTPVDENKVSNVSVYSLSGKLLFSTTKISDLKARQFNPGIYLVSVITDKERITKKVALVE